MCLAKVYLGEPNQGDPVAESVTALDTTANEVTAVSYTHLDVYKRQVSARSV